MKNFWQAIPMDDGSRVVVHVNRRGCKGRWTEPNAAALKALVQAVHNLDKVPDGVPCVRSNCLTARPLCTWCGREKGVRNRAE